MKAVLLLSGLPILFAANAGAAWVGICGSLEGQAGAVVLETLLEPGGGARYLVASDAGLPGCAMRNLPVEKARIKWATAITGSEASGLAGGVILKGAEVGGRFVANEVIPLNEPTRASISLPIGTELVPVLKTVAFGVEQRASVRGSGARVTIECSAGRSPAGVRLEGSAQALPLGASLALAIDAEADGDFRIGAVDGEHDRRGEPLELGTLTRGRAQAKFLLSSQLDAASWRAWVVLCPASDAQLEIRSMRLEPAPEQGPMPGRALWVWQPEAWQARPDELFALLAGHGADSVFVTVPIIDDGKRVAAPDELARFILRATLRGIRVWAVAGDPGAVLPGERERFAERAQAYAAYNRRAPAEARLAGLQLDIEPYLNAGYRIDVEGWLSAYLETLAGIRRAAEMPIDVAIPFWWGRQSYRGARLLDRLAPLVEVVTVMNYSTDRRRILEDAEPILTWAAQAHRGVRIGLEAGPLPDESLQVFRGDHKGELWLLPLEERALLLWLDAPAANPQGAAFAYSHTTRWRADRATFRRDLGALRSLLPELEGVWRAWPGFVGVALHGLDAH